jgi:hypothetical protein
MKRLFVTSVCLLAFNAMVLADWQPGQPAKWIQLPDLQPTGVDVQATIPKVLADDFLCQTSGPITDIHIWGSWLADYLPINSDGLPDPSLISFRLSIHADIPKTDANPYSTPATPDLWEQIFVPGQFTTNLYAQDLVEGWFNPNTREYLAVGDTKVWQYNFLIDAAAAFVQQGTPTNPITYWLAVEALPLFPVGVPEGLFGWKTSFQHWGDDAVYSDTETAPWTPLVYPPNHSFEGQSMDLAFVITPEPATMTLLGLGLMFLKKRHT